MNLRHSLQNSLANLTVRQSLTALCGGKAARNSRSAPAGSYSVPLCVELKLP